MNWKTMFKSLAISIGIFTFIVSIASPAFGVIDGENENADNHPTLSVPGQIQENPPQITGISEYAQYEIIIRLKENNPTIADPLKNISYSQIEIERRNVLERLKSQFKLKDEKPVFPDIIRNSRFASANGAGLNNAQETSPLPIYILKTDEEIKATCAKLMQDPGVEYAQPNYMMRIQATPNDPFYPQQWAHQNIYSEKAWDINTGSPDVIIAIIDTGIWLEHPDLSPNIWTNAGEIPGNGIDDDGNGYIDDLHGYDFFNKDGDPTDDHGHGTHCAGIASAVGNNGIGIAGVSWQCKLMAVKGLGAGGSGNSVQLAQCIKYAADNGAKILSNSWGPSGRASSNPVVEDAIDYAYAKDCVIVFAAGNANDDTAYYSPANYPKVIAVAATDKQDRKATFSNYGTKVAIAAPGVSILSTVPPTGPLGDTSFYKYLSGTSMACPHVAGLAALIKSSHAGFGNVQIANILRQGVDLFGEQITVQGVYIGTGRINAYQALRINDASNGEAMITSPADGADVSGIIGIAGTATDDNFDHYAVYYANGIYPAQWMLVYTSNTPIINDVLYPDLDTALLEDGSYSIKLAVTDKNSLMTETASSIIIKNKNIIITEPRSNDIFRAGEAIQIMGSVQASYFIEYGIGQDPQEWHTDGILLTNGGREGVDNGLLAKWDTASMTGVQYYTLKVTVNYPDGKRSILIRDIILDPAMKQGWPKRLDWPSSGNSGYYETVIADLDNDDLKEIIVASNGKPLQIYAFGNDGSALPGWPISLTAEGKIWHMPITGDIDNDGFNEVIVCVCDYSRNQKILHAIKLNGSEPRGWPVILPTEPYAATIAMADINNDGNNEVIVTDKDGHEGYKKLMIVNNEGIVISQRILTLPDSESSFSLNSSPAVGNFDDDHDLEIVVGGRGNNICIYNQDGSIVPGWPVYVNSIVLPSPAVGDINNDGEEEIVVGGYMLNEGQDGGIYAFDRNGNLLPGWPVHTDKNFWSSPSLADLDNDGDLEIAISSCSSGHETYVLHHDGAICAGWPKAATWSSWYSTVIGDVDQDGKPDIITTAGNGAPPYKGGVYAWNFNGTLINGFPKFTEVDAQAPPAISDIDSDGSVELIASSNYDKDLANNESKRRASIYVWEIPSAYDRHTMQWPVFHHDNQGTGRYNRIDAPVITIELEGPSIWELQEMLLGGSRNNTDENGATIHVIRNTGDVPVKVAIRYGPHDGSGLRPGLEQGMDVFVTKVGSEILSPEEGRVIAFVQPGAKAPLALEYGAPTEISQGISGMTAEYDIYAYPADQ